MKKTSFLERWLPHPFVLGDCCAELGDVGT